MKPRTFLIGMTWVALGALSPIATLVVDDWMHDAVINWHQISRVSATTAGAAVAAYWRKHKALLKFPPDIQEALNIEAQDRK